MAIVAKKKILLIDDDEMQLTTAELFLKDEYEIYKMNSGEEAIKFLSDDKNIPDLIMLDLLMPNMDGWEVLKRIKAMDTLKKVPVAFLTSIEEEEERKRAEKMGVADYILKPYNMTNLKNRIKDTIKQHPVK